MVDHTPDLFIPDITPEIRARVIAELREEADKYVEAGRDAFPGICGVMHTGGDPEGKPAGLYSEEKTLACTRAVFTRMLDAAEGVELYRPSNGTEGECFMAKFCYRCTKDEDESCEIVASSMIYDIDDQEYPREWRQDGEQGPRCTAFEPRDGA